MPEALAVERLEALNDGTISDLTRFSARTVLELAGEEKVA